MNISNTTGYNTDCGIETPEVSFFIPSPEKSNDSCSSPADITERVNESGIYCSARKLGHDISQVLPVRVPSRRLREFLNVGISEYTGLQLKRFTIVSFVVRA